MIDSELLDELHRLAAAQAPQPDTLLVSPATLQALREARGKLRQQQERRTREAEARTREAEAIAREPRRVRRLVARGWTLAEARRAR